MSENIYVSLDEAREELEKRWANQELKSQIENELGGNLIPNFPIKPRAVLTRQMCSPDNGFAFFYQCAKYINAYPTAQEFTGDIFVHFNEEKKGLGRLRVMQEDGTKSMVDIMDFHANEKKPLKECILKTGENLVDFHHNLLRFSKYPVDLYDNTSWYRHLGRASDYYYYLLLHFVAHGVLFETFFDEDDGSESSFTNSVVLPAINKIKDKFNLKPLVIHLYPENQNDEEDFYWWCYPPYINKYIIDYIKKNNLPFKECKIKK